VGGRGAVAIPLIVAVVVFFVPEATANQYWVRQIALIATFGLVAGGLNLSFGYAGELQFGQLFMFATGAYIAAAVGTRLTSEIIPLMLIGGVVASVIGVLVVIPALRVGGWALAIASFYLVVALPSFVQLLQKYTGGPDGIATPVPKLFGTDLSTTGLYHVVIVATIAWFAAYRNLVRSRYGVVFRILKQSPELAASLGYSPRRLKALAYGLGAFPAGMAGVLYGFLSQYVVPDMFTLSVMVGILAAVVFGGAQSVYGAFFGAALLQLGPMGSLSFQKYALVAYGAFLIIAGIVFRRGVAGIGLALGRRVANALAGSQVAPMSIATAGAAPDAQEAAPALTAPAGSILQIEGVAKSYAGVQALRGVSLTAQPGEITALIGSNGSGKTTMLNVICGYARNEQGSVSYGDAKLNGLAPQQVAAHRVGRTFQTPNIPVDVSVLDVVASGRFATDRCGILATVLRLPRFWKVRREDREAAYAALDLVGLRPFAEEPAASQPLGTRRLVEVARMLCGGASLLLLDEPASGLSESEVERLGAVLERAAEAGATVVLIEHNFGFVTSVSTTAHVLHFGELLASGPARTIGNDPSVIESYLGAAAPARPADVEEPIHLTTASREVTDA
jgi:branched-chain amino acid transport system permease protein